MFTKWPRIISNCALIAIGVILGVAMINQYQANRRVIALTNRDSTVSLVRQLHLAITANRDLKNENANLNEALSEIQGGRDAREVARRSIARYQLLDGTVATEGRGVELTIDLALDPIWLVDLVNELFIRGAEKIALNNRLLTERSSFTLTDGTVYLNGDIMLQTPYQFAVIGDQGALLQGLAKKGGILERIKDQFPNSNDKLSLAGRDLVILPPKPNL